MKEAIVTLDTINPVDFFGTNNQYFQLIKDKYPLVKFFSRGTKIKLSGSEENVKKVLEKINAIIIVLEKYGSINYTMVEQFLESNNMDIKKQLEQTDSVLLYTNSGKTIKARTKNQKNMVQTMASNDILFAIGPAGTGKTYTAVAIAVKALKEKVVKKIILTRPAVEAGENLGFLPGDLKEKIDPYLRPLYDSLEDMIPVDKLTYYMTTRTIEIAPLAYMRGRTLDNAYIILDEAQNSTEMQLKMFLTRIGTNAKAIITGDLTQIDLPRNQKSGLQQATEMLKDIQGIGIVFLDEQDVVRHKLVKDIIKAYEKLDLEKKSNNNY